MCALTRVCMCGCIFVYSKMVLQFSSSLTALFIYKGANIRDKKNIVSLYNNPIRELLLYRSFIISN